MIEVTEYHHDHEQPGEMNEAFLAHALTPQNLGVLPNPQGFAHPRGPCGDSIELYLKIDDERITDARFMSDGCLHTLACGSALTELVKGLTLDEAIQIDAERLDQELGGLPPDHKHCAQLAADTLQEAIRDYYQRRRAPWKSLYQTKGS